MRHPSLAQGRLFIWIEIATALQAMLRNDKTIDLPQRVNTLFANAKCTGRNDNIGQSLRLALHRDGFLIG